MTPSRSSNSMTSSSSRSRRRARAATADHPPSACKTLHRGIAGGQHGRQRRVVRAHALDESRSRTAAPAAIRRRAATCTGVDTDKVGVADQLEPARAPRRRARPGPSTAIHPSLTCGSPADFDSPPRRNCRHPAIRRLDCVAHRRRDSRRTPRRRSAPRRARRSAASAPRAQRRDSTEPVGLFGLTASTARVRGVHAASTLSNPPSIGRDRRADTERRGRRRGA